jgi:hypothetical protein
MIQPDINKRPLAEEELENKIISKKEVWNKAQLNSYMLNWLRGS